MSNGFPVNTLAMIIVAMIATGVSAWGIFAYGASRVSAALRSTQAWRWGAALLLVAWFAARVIVSLNPPSAGLATTVATSSFIVAGLAAGLLPLLFSPAYRQIVRAIPQTWLVGVHAIRMAGLLFLALADMRLLPAQFALPAGYGDITTGALALAVVYLLANQKPYARAAAIAWNLFGLLDFVVAVSTGVRFIGPFTAQIAASGQSIGYLNVMFFIPTFGVPVFALLHIYSLYRLLTEKGTVRQAEPVRARQTA